MRGADLIEQIIRAYLEQHRSINEIVRTLRISRATVRKVKCARGVQPTPKLWRLGRGSDGDPGEGSQAAGAGAPLNPAAPTVTYRAAVRPIGLWLARLGELSSPRITREQIA